MELVLNFLSGAELLLKLRSETEAGQFLSYLPLESLFALEDNISSSLDRI